MAARAGFLGLMLVPFWTQMESTANLDLGVVSDVFAAGDRISVPVTLVMQGEAQIGKVSLAVLYPSQQLHWVEANLDESLQASGAQLRTEMRDGGEKGAIFLEISSSAPISQGSLVSLGFDLTVDPKVDQEMRLENQEPRAWSLEGLEINARGLDGSVTSIEFIPACFFYMH